MSGSSEQRAPLRAYQRPISVSIIDDSAIVRGLFARWLEEQPDIDVIGIHPNGPDALKHIGAVKPDVVILDLMMPGMDGLQVLPLIHQLAPAAAVLIVSSASEAGADMTLRCLMRGAAHYLPKPTALESMRGGDTFKHSLLDTIRSLNQA